MDVTSCSEQLLAQQHAIRNLPDEILNILRRGRNEQYIKTLSKLLLDPAWTDALLVTHEPLLAELCGRWLEIPEVNDLHAVAALARILPLTPHLSVYVEVLWVRSLDRTLKAASSRRAAALQELPVESLQKFLLALCRLLMFDNDMFASMVSPVQLQLLLQHRDLHIRYLAIRILCLYLHASDTTLASMVQSYVGGKEINGLWDEKPIDYTFFSLWESRRHKDLHENLQKIQQSHSMQSTVGNSGAMQRVINFHEFSGAVLCICGVLVPTPDRRHTEASSLVLTESIEKNMRKFAEGLNGSKPLLVTGFSGSGKSLLVAEIAQKLGKDSSMVTLHLNEQTDAKLLIGTYTSAKTPGSFSWRPGVLTTAVKEGKWVLVEDLDRAPLEIISTLLPLLERRELFLSGRGETIRAAPGFRLIATIRSALNNRGAEYLPVTRTIGIRHWLQIPFQVPKDVELQEIVVSRFPILSPFLPIFMNVYRALKEPGSLDPSSLAAKHINAKPFGPQDLLKFCDRVRSILQRANVTANHEPIPEALNDYVFLEAIDCFVASIPSGYWRAQATGIIAQNLHVPLARVHYCLDIRKPDYHFKNSNIHFGRTRIPVRHNAYSTKSSITRQVAAPFADTPHVLRIMESIAVAITQAEPCLLVGETGIGKTTIIQRLADTLNQKLTVVNLSQQSEANDLLGGYKPVNMRALAVPMQEEFDDLLSSTFITKRNQHFIGTLRKSIAKGRWARVLTLWQEALRLMANHLEEPSLDNKSVREPISKRRKLRSSKAQLLKSRWENFASEVKTFQKHLGSGSNGFAFSFVEGNVIKAVRNGEWVLLDEINLASPDTLESLADLFSSTVSGGPSILLTESGDAERIVAHQDFRVFGAMNPATDIGKRDLPESLRSRFTEIYIEAPDKDLNTLVAVVKAYLDDDSHADPRVATDVAQLYLGIQKLEKENRLVDGANQKPHFSLRTLTRSLIYVLDIARMYGLRRALFEGFSMSFLTVLNLESQLLIQPLIDQYILAPQKNIRAALRQLPRRPQDSQSYVQFSHYWIARGTEPIQKLPHYIITPFIERNLLNLVRATSSRRFPVLLQGPTSSGKTSMIEYLARISGNKFVRINNHEHTDLQEYLGTYVSGPDGHIRYQEGVLVHALREGYWVVLDELNLAPTDVLEALNRLLDDNRELLVPETQQIVRPHKDFMLFATQNPPGIYGGRKALSRAFRNRFLELHFDDIPEDELETILRERSQIAPSFCTKIVAVYKKLSVLRQTERLFEQRSSFATLRDLFRWALRDADDRDQLAVNGFLLLAERVRNTEERLAVKRVIEEVLKVSIDESKIYDIAIGTECRSRSSIGIHSQRTVWTKSMRRLYVLVSEALKNNEPVLLVGETGTGKTSICQTLASLHNTKLFMVNAHQNTETSDFIGAQRPVRNRALAESVLVEDLVDILNDHAYYKESLGRDVSSLLDAYESLRLQDPTGLTNETQSRVERSRTKAQALFEWVDGCLVHAMQDGQYFLLDEISLADDSVLERLNSVLEPARSLFLAEKGSNDASVTAVPGFQFLATMNPGGDYGKRELSPALRNRFTEIWVPSLMSQSELLEIVRANLHISSTEISAPMVEFAAWYASVYNNSAPSISMRDLLAWVQFVNNFRCPIPNVSLLHGAAMIYIDRIGASSAFKTLTTGDMVFRERQRCLSKLDEFFCRDLTSIYDQTSVISVTNDTFTIGYFSIARRSSIHHNPLDYSLMAPTTLTNAMKIARALQIQKPILLEGSPGVGKTTLVAALAEATGMPLTRINLSDQTDLMDLFGSDVPIEEAEAGSFSWRDAPFLRAMQKGEWVLLDEMNLASQSVLEGLNSCLDHRGQVYVSELDSTFEKHPDFVVFAAQNPHHQGGGRKGLPASFVNRFTVVYANDFTAGDLLAITNELYPSLPRELKDTTVSCVSALSRLLQNDHRIGALGGPWEINLRDILRWLDLLQTQDGLSSLQSCPADFVDLLFLQRFRNSEDVAAIKRSLQQYLRGDRAVNLFQGKSVSLVEIGLGLLPRTTLSQPLFLQRCNRSHFNLSIAESVMLCIQKKWPCLLVGEPESGKTNLIHQLASCVGADVIEISLNSDMDNMDLIGGYEQMDVQREVANFVRRLQSYTRKILIQHLDSGIALSDGLAEFEAKAGTGTELTEIMRLISNAAKKHPAIDLIEFLDECRHLIQRSSAENGARFEWVDGILIKALKRGSWLILDNANLCSSSVLDRLNSLLEPNGFLSINERRTHEGTASIVKPHPDFRLFFTMDPHHGELSRSMRNRSIELYMTAQETKSMMNVLDPQWESANARYSLFQTFDWNSLDDVLFEGLFNICLDHLSFADLKFLQQWQIQIASGLIHLTDSKKTIISFNIDNYKQMIEHHWSILRKIQENYIAVAGLSTDQTAFVTMQTIHPFNNSMLLSQMIGISSINDLEWLGYSFELLLGTCRFNQKLNDIAQNVLSKPLLQLSRLERSIASETSKSFRNDTTRPVAGFLQEMGLILRSILNDESLGKAADRSNVLLLVEEVLIYLQEILDITHQYDFDEGVFQVYQSIGRYMVSNLKTDLSERNPGIRLASTMITKLRSFDASWRLSSGQSMQRLWQTFRPPTVKNLSQLEVSLAINALANRFDNLRWRSGASIKELALLQDSILRIHNFIATANIEFMESLEEIHKSLEELERRPHFSDNDGTPYFQAQAEMLYQLKCFVERSVSLEIQSMLGLLAGRSTNQYMECGASSPAWNCLSWIQKSTTVGHAQVELAAIRNIFPISMLQQLEEINGVPLHSLDLLCAEMEFMATILATDTSTIIRASLHDFETMVQKIYKQFHASLSIDGNMDQSKSIKEGLNQLLQSFNMNSRIQDPLNEKSTHLSRCIDMAVGSPSHEVINQLTNSFERTSSDCIQFFTGCLLFYVPDRIFDPALKPMVERTRHSKRKAELEIKLHALQYFEQIFSGQDSSFRIRLAKRNLQALGAEPQVPSIVRPQIPELGLLQAEFNNILGTICLRSPSVSTLQSVFQGQALEMKEISLLRTNIAQTVSRLSSIFYAYQDVTKPLIAMLHGLDAGLALALLSGSRMNSIDHAMEGYCRLTPFLGASPNTVFDTHVVSQGKTHNTGMDPRQHVLKSIAGFSSTTGLSQSKLENELVQMFHGLYQDWAEQLDKDQRLNAANSSMYRYRGTEEDIHEADEKDFLDLFPNYDDYPYANMTLEKVKIDPRNQAQQLAQIHRDIFGASEKAPQQLLNLITCTSQEIANLWCSSESPVCSVPAENLLAPLMLSLSTKLSGFQTRTMVTSSYNFYVDKNFAEARQLVTLVHKIQDRFIELHEVWPEHATLSDVLRISSELLAMRWSEPIAKLLTKAEKLHNCVNEWQRVASKQYTAIALYDQLTELLVTWRRLELSTWASLLNMEDQRCNDDADAWWFVAYDAIIAVPLSMISSGKDIHMHVESLFSTLIDFLENTSLGQYSHRLGMINCFRQHAEILGQEAPPMYLVSTAIANFLSYYSRYQQLIEDYLHKERQQFEKNLKEILLLASWKDTNIIALRESAKRSHHKLFKVIRKYRVLLARPSVDVLTGSFPESSDVSRPSLKVMDALAGFEATTVDLRAFNICKQNIQGWENKAERLINPAATAERMYKVCQPPLGAIDFALHLDAFGEELADHIRVLQKETPAEATEQNSEALKHLKNRKRKLFADTLRAIRQMGFKSNLGGDVLAKQASLAKVLANTAVFDNCPFESEMKAAEYYFHKLLNIMPQVRERSRNYSQDLSQGEAARSLGYLENILSLVLQQRQNLAIALGSFKVFGETMQRMINLWSPDQYLLAKQTQGQRRFTRDTSCVLQWLPNILEVGIMLVRNHSKLSNNEYATVLEHLIRWKNKISSLKDVFDALPKLPVNIATSKHAIFLAEAKATLEGFRGNLNDLAEANPQVAFILKQVNLWTDYASNGEDEREEDAHVQLMSDFETEISMVSDSILVSIQKLQEKLSAIPTSDEDTTWLIRSETCLSDSLTGLNPRQIIDRLENAMSAIQHLDPSDGVGLDLAGAVCAMAAPIVQQYHSIQQATLARYVDTHRALCKLGSLLACSFSQIAMDGFCSPPDKLAAESGKTEKLEGGTGLGEGEGAEDISKDIEDDEDLSELAQEGNKTNEHEELEDEKDAVDMDHEEIEGDLDGESDRGAEDDSGDDGGGSDLDEETGSVDDLDPSAVDEKLWDGENEDVEAEKDGSKAKGKSEKDREAASEPVGQKEHMDDDADVNERDEDSELEVAEGEDVNQEDTEKIDSHAQDGQKLDLPEEMDLDNLESSDDETASKLSDMEGLSDVEDRSVDDQQEENQSEEGSKGDFAETSSPKLGESVDGHDTDENSDSAHDAGSPVDTDPDMDQEGEPKLAETHNDRTKADQENAAQSDVRGLGESNDIDEDQSSANQAEAGKGTKGTATNDEEIDEAVEDGQTGQIQHRHEVSQAQNDFPEENIRSQAFKKLGDALEKWHRQHKKIHDAAADRDRNAQEPHTDLDMRDQDLEHVEDEKAQSDAQALGAATDEQAQSLDQRALDSAVDDDTQTRPTADADEDSDVGQDEVMDDLRSKDKIIQERSGEESQSRSEPTVPNRLSANGHQTSLEIEHEEDIVDLDSEMSTTHLQSSDPFSTRSAEDARSLWSHYENLTRDLALSLTEQLRLILAPTLATKMRGDFRTGKRLNIKRIIPYIASQYKRDKIWMRRSIPSKRNYQIMLAVDDSRSMGESGSSQLAFQALALITKSLSMLEVGEICVVGFGSDVKVAHAFDKTFSSEAGAQIFQHFGFQQTKTNVRKLIADSIALFREARRKTFNAGADLWQLQLIISDGVCEDHDTIRRLVRQAQEERIMVIFVIVDALLKSESIMDMSQAVFEPDSHGETKLKIKRYLDEFPFRYYLVVGEVRELPGVLAQALRQWFAEVAGSEF